MKRRKKSESLEVRLPLEDKEAFMSLCQQRGMTASEMIRAYIVKETRTVRSHTFTHKGAITMSLITTTFLGIAAFTLQSDTASILESRSLISTELAQEQETEQQSRSRRQEIEQERARALSTARRNEISHLREIERQAGPSDYVPDESNYRQELMEIESHTARFVRAGETSLDELGVELRSVEDQIASLESQSHRSQSEERQLTELVSRQRQLLDMIETDG